MCVFIFLFADSKPKVRLTSKFYCSYSNFYILAESMVTMVTVLKDVMLH